MQNLYIIAGCNGAGKTTASFNILPEILNCKEFVNADEIARGISPFRPENVSFEAGRIMLERIHELLQEREDFAFETTLSTKSFKNTVTAAQELGYQVTLIFFWLDSEQLAIDRVKNRVLEGGHSIPVDVIRRRYHAGLRNLFDIYLEKVDNALIFDNSKATPELVAEMKPSKEISIFNETKFNLIKSR